MEEEVLAKSYDSRLMRRLLGYLKPYSGSIALSLAFLVEILAEQKESPPLAAGEIVSTGTLTDAHPVKPGERWSTDLHGFATRGLEIEFT